MATIILIIQKMTTIEKQIKNKEEEADVSDVEEELSEVEESDAEENHATQPQPPPARAPNNNKT